ncbi:MAG: TolC family protein [Saprospiraceae bacterium]|nr:TolC family protein [Saprospiraceae bacterium]
MNIIRYLVTIVLFVVCFLPSQSQDFAPFIEMVWNNNHQLKSHEFELENARLSMEEAKAMYRPTVTFGTQYTLASGGRAIDFPVGDLLNPVHNTLNELTGSQQFPQLSNQTILFLPNNFYDARFRIQQPVYYPDLSLNRQAKGLEQELRGLEIKAYKRLLVKEFMDAYFQWKQSLQAIEIYAQAEQLIQEAARSTGSMIRNGVALPSALARIKGELATVTAQQIEAKAIEENAWSYLIFIAGDPDLSRIEMSIDLIELPEVNAGENNRREELQQLDLGLRLNQLAVDKEDNFFKPTLGVQLDLGSQDFDFGLQPYGLLGINFNWNLFDGNRHRLRRQQALTKIEVNKERKIQVQKQFDLQVGIARNNLAAAIDQALTFRPRIEAGESTYHDVEKKYKSGSANYLELLDARIQLTQAQITYLVSRFQAWTKWSEYQYNSALYPIP